MNSQYYNSIWILNFESSMKTWHSLTWLENSYNRISPISEWIVQWFANRFNRLNVKNKFVYQTSLLCLIEVVSFLRVWFMDKQMWKTPALKFSNRFEAFTQNLREFHTAPQQVDSCESISTWDAVALSIKLMHAALTLSLLFNVWKVMHKYTSASINYWCSQNTCGGGVNRSFQYNELLYTAKSCCPNTFGAHYSSSLLSFGGQRLSQTLVDNTPLLLTHGEDLRMGIYVMKTHNNPQWAIFISKHFAVCPAWKQH